MIAYKNGIYQGQIRDGIKDGLGVFWWPSGAFYIGEWYNDQIHGEGVLAFQNQVLRAQFKKNKLHGVCIDYQKKEYNQYEFGYLNGKCIQQNKVLLYRRGDLISTLDEDSLILCELLENRLLTWEEINERNHYTDIGISSSYIGCHNRSRIPHGLGMLQDERLFIGLFTENTIHGIGQVYKNEDIYTGQLKNNLYHGLGIYYIEGQQKIIQGQFEQGICKQLYSVTEGTYDKYRQLSELVYQKIQQEYRDQRVQLPFLQDPSEGQTTERVVQSTRNRSDNNTPTCFLTPGTSTPLPIKTVHLNLGDIDIQTFRPDPIKAKSNKSPSSSIHSMFFHIEESLNASRRPSKQITIHESQQETHKFSKTMNKIQDVRQQSYALMPVNQNITYASAYKSRSASKSGVKMQQISQTVTKAVSIKPNKIIYK